MKVTGGGSYELVHDGVVIRPVFHHEATLTQVAARAADSPRVGVVLDWLEVGTPCLPVTVQEMSWGQVKSRYR
jgi:hypothetical protein